LSAQRFGFLLDDDAGDEVVEVKRERRKGEEKRSGKDREKSRHMRKREYNEKEWESDEEEKSRKRRKNGDDVQENEDMEMDTEDEDAKRERLRQEDLKDRDAFADRVREKDRERTKKIVEDRSSRNSGDTADAARRRQLADDSEARGVALPALRQHSRQEYLTKREIQQIELLRKEIADDEALFRGMKVSRRERREVERKRELLKLVEERLKIDDKWDGYALPEDYITEQGKIDKRKKENALYKRYEEAKPKDDQFVTDVDQWEASQTKHSTFRTGAMDKPEVTDDYEYVFDESQTIKFVMESTLEDTMGTMSAADKLLQSQIEEAEKRGKFFVYNETCA
jgi:pre-mRNA-splicing factor ATP-dependent RNA helicase DHX16